MFEKEAEEEINKEHWKYSIFKDLAQEYWQKGAEFGYNEKCSEFEKELKWERDTKTELAEHLGKANDKVADLEETINKLREQLALRYDLEDKIKELEETNKANEWHYVKDGDLPKKELEEKQLLVRVRNYTEDYIFAYYMLDKYYSKNGKRFYSDIDCDYPIDLDDIIAWKEIVLPKESE